MSFPNLMVKSSVSIRSTILKILFKNFLSFENRWTLIRPYEWSGILADFSWIHFYSPFSSIFKGIYHLNIACFGSYSYVFSFSFTSPPPVPLCLSIGWMVLLLVASSADRRFRFRSLYAMLVLPLPFCCFCCLLGVLGVLCVG